MKTKFLSLLWFVSVFQTAGLLTPSAAHAQAYPNRPIRLIVPFAPGGPTDITARLAANGMPATLGQAVVIENIAGASGAVGAEKAAKSPKDGYTLLLATSTIVSTNPNLYKNLPYSVNDFAPVAMVAQYPLVFSVSPGFPAKTLKEFASYAKAHPGKVNYSTTGRGSTTHIIGEMLKAALAIEIVDIQYKGNGPQLAGLLGGEVQLMSDAIATSLPQYKAGKLRWLAVTSEQRSPVAPDVPSVVELGYPQLVVFNIFAILAPNGTPRSNIDRLNASVNSVLQTDEVRARLIADGATVEMTTPEALAAIIKVNSEVWGRQIRRLAIQLD